MDLKERCQKILDERSTGFTVVSILKHDSRAYNTKISAVCKHGHVSDKNLSAVVRIGCVECKGSKSSRKLSKDEIRSRLIARRLFPIELGESTMHPAKLKCMECSHIFSMKALNKALHTTGCPKCAGNVRKDLWELQEHCLINGWRMNWSEYDEDKYTMSYMHGRCSSCGNKHSGTILKKYIEGFAKCGHCTPRVTGFKVTKPAIL